MKLQKVFVRSAVLLGGLLVIQLAVLAVIYINQENEPTHLHASWHNTASSMEEAIEMSDEVIMAKVMKVRKGKDIVVKVEGDEPGSKGGTFKDKIPTMEVELEVMKTMMKNDENRGKGKKTMMKNDENRGKGKKGMMKNDENRGKGKKGMMMTLFQTGNSVGATVGGLPDEAMPPVEPADTPDEGEGRMFVIEDDPPYHVGEQYALFLTKGPGKMMAVIAPEGRYRMDMREGKMMMHPVTDRGMALDMMNMPQEQFEEEVCGKMKELGMDDKMGEGCM